MKFLTKVKVTNKKVPADRSFDLEFQWQPDGETILIPGRKHIVFIQKDDESDQWSLINEEKIFHNAEITSMTALANSRKAISISATVAATK